MNRLDFSRLWQEVSSCEVLPWAGRIVEVAGMVIASSGPPVALGDFCEIRTASGRRVRSQVVGFREGHVLSMPLEGTDGIQLGDPVVSRPNVARVGVGPDLQGRVLDGFGQVMDRGPRFVPEELYPLYPQTIGSPLDREHIDEPLETGVRAIDGFTLCGRGQRLGLFGGSGVGKSTLLGTMTRNSVADVTVIALIGERNREVRAFLEQEMGPEGRARSVVVCATSDQSAPLRVRACFVALAIAEYFRDQGKDVLFIMDSVTRLAMAQREIGLAAGEPPSQKGYTPSVFNLLPKILERAGRFKKGSITGLFTVLVEGDDLNEPICDAVRSILDGHVVLSRRLAAGGHYPAIDVLHSISRLFLHLATSDHARAAVKVREAMALLEESRDLIDLGAYVAGRNPKLDAAIATQDQILGFLRQDFTPSRLSDTVSRLSLLAEKL